MLQNCSDGATSGSRTSEIGGGKLLPNFFNDRFQAFPEKMSAFPPKEGPNSIANFNGGPWASGSATGWGGLGTAQHALLKKFVITALSLYSSAFLSGNAWERSSHAFSYQALFISVYILVYFRWIYKCRLIQIVIMRYRTSNAFLNLV